MGRSPLLIAALAAALTAQRSGAACDCKIAFATDRDDGNVEIYVMEEDGSNPVNLTRTSTDAIYPAWISAEAASAIRAMAWGAVKAQIGRSGESGVPDSR